MNQSMFWLGGLHEFGLFSRRFAGFALKLAFTQRGD